VSRGCVSWWWTLRVPRLQPAAMEFAGSANVRERKGRVALFPHSHHRSGAHITHQANIHTKIQRRKRGNEPAQRSRRCGEDRRLQRRRRRTARTAANSRTKRRSRAQLGEQNCRRSQEIAKEERTPGQSNPEPTLNPLASSTRTQHGDDTHALAQITAHRRTEKHSANIPPGGVHDND
jgi:hypothetical protein